MSRRVPPAAAVLAIAAGLCAPAAASAPTAAPAPGVRAWLIQATDGRARPLDGHIELGSPADATAMLVTAKLLPDGRRELWGGDNSTYAEFGRWSAWPTVFWSPGQQSPACPAPSSCRPPQPMKAETWPLPLRVPPGRYEHYFVTDGAAAVRFRITSPGWRVTEITGRFGIGFHLHRSTPEAAATGVIAGPYSVEHFRGVTAPGGRHGSVAVAILPCDEGAGSGTLRGGTQVSTFGADVTCGRTGTTAVAPGSTAWELDGESVGYTTARNRLAVLDLPSFARPAV